MHDRKYSLAKLTEQYAAVSALTGLVQLRDPLSPVVHSTCEGANSVCAESRPAGFNLSSRLTSYAALGKLLYLCGDWFPHLQNGYNLLACYVIKVKR